MEEILYLTIVISADNKAKINAAGKVTDKTMEFMKRVWELQNEIFPAVSDQTSAKENYE